MRYILTESEALLIKQKFGFGQLLGLNVNQIIRPGTEKELLERGVISFYNGKEELSNVYRALFSHWTKMRYSIVRPELNDDAHLQCVLTNDRVSIFFVRNEDKITMDLFDFSEEKFDKVIVAFADMIQTDSKMPGFNIGMSREEYDQFIKCNKSTDFIAWSKKLGINADLLEKLAFNINL